MATGSADAHRCDSVKTVSESRMTMRAYPHYRDSGVEWLGEVPEHWVLRPLKSVLAKNDGGVWGMTRTTMASAEQSFCDQPNRQLMAAGQSAIQLGGNCPFARRRVHS